MAEPRPYKTQVVGSIPTWPTMIPIPNSVWDIEDDAEAVKMFLKIRQFDRAVQQLSTERLEDCLRGIRALEKRFGPLSWRGPSARIDWENGSFEYVLSDRDYFSEWAGPSDLSLYRALDSGEVVGFHLTIPRNLRRSEEDQ